MNFYQTFLEEIRQLVEKVTDQNDSIFTVPRDKVYKVDDFPYSGNTRYISLGTDGNVHWRDGHHGDMSKSKWDSESAFPNYIGHNSTELHPNLVPLVLHCNGIPEYNVSSVGPHELKELFDGALPQRVSAAIGKPIQGVSDAVGEFTRNLALSVNKLPSPARLGG